MVIFSFVPCICSNEKNFKQNKYVEGQESATLIDKMSLVMRKPAFSICENKDVDQLHGDREADQRLCFRYTDSIIPLLSKSEILSF